MKLRSLILILLALALAGSVAWAQGYGYGPRQHRCACGCGWGPGPRWGPGPMAGPGVRLYNPDTVTTLRGTVAAVEVVPAGRGRIGGTHVTLQSEGKQTEVHLGPTWFVEQSGWKLAKGDAVEVTGSLVRIGEASYLIARTVKKGDKVLDLRDPRGLPLWAGQQRP